MNLSLEKLNILTEKHISAIDEDQPLKNLMTVAGKKNFTELIKYFESPYYSSNFLFIPKPEYLLMLYVLFFSLDEYIAILYKYTTIRSLNRSTQFAEIFYWFFNEKKIDYAFNFSFICENTRISRKSIQLFLIRMTFQVIEKNQWNIEDIRN